MPLQKPFHESIVDVLREPQDANQITAIAKILLATKVPWNRPAIRASFDACARRIAWHIAAPELYGQVMDVLAREPAAA